MTLKLPQVYMAFCLLASLLVGVSACQEAPPPEPVVIYITATPEAPPNQASPFPSLTPSPAQTLIAFPSVTFTPSPVPSQTPFPTLTPSNTPLFSPSPDPQTLAPFPSSTAPTASPIPPSPTPLPEVQAPAATFPPTEVAVLPPPPSESEVQIIVPAAVSDSAPPPEALPILNASRLGVQIHPFVTNEEWAAALNLSRQLKIEWIKFQIPWEVAEPSPGQFSADYERLVLLVQEAHIQGYKVLVSVNRAPAWARPPGADLSQHGPPADPQALAAFITRLMSDIKPEFMEALEVWNEPNLIREWQGAPMDGATYMRYFAAAYQAAKAIDPEAVVVTAGLAPVGDIAGAARDDRAFLREMYAGGLLDFPAARIGIHPYGWANAPEARCCAAGGWADAPQFFMLDTLDEYRAIMLANNDLGRLAWVTEFGWGSFQGLAADGTNASPPPQAAFMERISQSQQADYTLRAIALMQGPDYGYIELKFLWNMNFATVQNAIADQLEQAGYSFLDAGGRPRPVFFYILNARKFYEEE